MACLRGCDSEGLHVFTATRRCQDVCICSIDGSTCVLCVIDMLPRLVTDMAPFHSLCHLLSSTGGPPAQAPGREQTVTDVTAVSTNSQPACAEARPSSALQAVSRAKTTAGLPAAVAESGPRGPMPRRCALTSRTSCTSKSLAWNAQRAAVAYHAGAAVVPYHKRWVPEGDPDSRGDVGERATAHSGAPSTIGAAC